ncbi:hypothetical protein K458DRAFT_310096 [Lentithecium fluviatile CBS 122367]|uniref:EthD domain-containing protein n=1 Tax=Lentithecium fluviatile CBS 122367 TaxID=1168545 RepID=A0A6G1ITK3_9PLEO|nr:hypothetical protein K458DRAFT_310096 [Lentithecium fluviatile CBS 122367]
MPPAPYLLHVNSRPTLVSAPTWKKFYLEEHLPELINTGTSKTAALYEEIDLPGDRDTGSQRRWLAIYQTDFAEPLKSENAKNLTWTSEILSEGGKHTDVSIEHFDVDTRNYELIQTYNPKGVGEAPAPEILTAEMHPNDAVDFDNWYREEHLQKLSKLPGYRRTLRYKLGPKTHLTKGDVVPAFLAMHEIDDVVKALEGKELEETNGTEWTKKVLADCNIFFARGWKLVGTAGY